MSAARRPEKWKWGLLFNIHTLKKFEFAMGFHGGRVIQIDKVEWGKKLTAASWKQQPAHTT